MSYNRSIKKEVRKNKNKNKKNSKKTNKKISFFFILSIVVSMLVLNLNMFSTKDQVLILKEPDKVTYVKDLEALVKQGKVKAVYTQENSPVLLFTVEEGVKVKSVEYEAIHSRSIEKLISQSENYLNQEIKDDRYVLTYRSFNPDTDNFKELLYSNNVQVLKIPTESNSAVFDILKSIGMMGLYLLLFKILFFPSKKEKLEGSDIPDVTFSDIAGNEEAKEELMFIVDFLKNPEEFNKLGAQLPKGLLLNGSPGNGKTMLAKAIAGEAGVPFYYKSGTDFLDKYVGVGPQRVKNLFEKARAKAPCIVFIDEIDSIGGARGGSHHKEYDNMLNQLLVELDGFEPTDGVIVIAATNRIDSLDSALIRPGRFDRHITIGLPDKSDRKKILELYLKDKPVASDVDVNSLAGLLYGYSGAKVKSFINDAALVATRKRHAEITKKDFDEAFVKMTLSSNPKKRVDDNKNTEIIAYHEAGHALVTKLWTDDTINKVSIIGTTGNVGGFTASTPSEEFLLSRKDFYNRIRVLYGGRIAEYLYFDEDYDSVTSGASNDLKKVGEYLDLIIKELGMNETMLFAMSSTEANNEDVLRYKNELALKLYNETLESLKLNRVALDAIVEALIEKESLSTKEFDEIISQQSIKYTEVMKKYINVVES